LSRNSTTSMIRGISILLSQG